MLFLIYCTPFFSACKEKFYKIPDFFANPMNRKQQVIKKLPKNQKNRLQPPACGPMKEPNPQKQAEGVAQPQIPLTNPETVLQPSPKGGKGQQEV